MTVPAGGALTTPLVPGAAPVLLTEYAGGADNPVYVINLDPAGPRIYLGSGSNVGPNTGVPVDPGTSSTWSAPGPLYAVADPAGIKNATVVVTAAVSDWQVSPATIAAQVAAELLAGGVPNVYTETPIESDVIPAGAVSGFIDVHSYACVLFDVGAAGFARSISIGWYDQNNQLVTTDLLDFAPFTAASVPTVAVVPVRSAKCIINNNTVGFTLTVKTYGANRSLGELRTANQPQRGDSWSVNTATVAGNTYPLVQANPGIQLQGQVWISILVGGAAATGGIEMVIAGTGTVVVVADSAEMFAAAIGSGARRIMKMIAIPAGPYSFQFHCVGTGDATARTYSINLVQA